MNVAPQAHLLAPHQSQLYTWDDPTLPRELLWNIYNRKNEDIAAVIDKVNIFGHFVYNLLIIFT